MYGIAYVNCNKQIDRFAVFALQLAAQLNTSLMLHNAVSMFTLNNIFAVDAHTGRIA
jgi:hypothetical protein